MSRTTVTAGPERADHAKETPGTAAQPETIRAALAEIAHRERLAETLKSRGRIALDVDDEILRQLRQDP